MNRCAFLSSGLLVLGLTGCANYATLQDAETMPEHEFQLGVGATFNAYPLQLESTHTDASGTQVTDTSTATVTVPALIVSGRYGVSDRLELHAIGWLPFGASFGGKVRVVGDRQKGGFAFSPGLDVSAPILASVDDKTALLMDFYVPLHMGYRFSPQFELYWTPKYVLRLVDSEIDHAAGGTLGIAIGEKTQVMLEGGVLYDTLWKKPIINGGIAIGFSR